MAVRAVFFGVASRYIFDAMEVAQRADIEIAAFVHNLDTALAHALSPLVLPGELSADLLSLPVAIPLVTPGYRKKLEAEALSLGFTNFLSLRDPTSVVAQSCIFGDGAHINAGAVIGAHCRFGRQVLVNRSASLGHDAIVGDYVTFGPAAVLCGSCTIADGVFIGANATVLPEITIGKNAVIGAGAVVVKNIPAHTVVTGNPGRIVRTGTLGYNGTGV